LSYKAHVLRLQEPIFNRLALSASDGTNAEQRAVKREIMDYIITLFGYLAQDEVRELVVKISKEHKFRIKTTTRSRSHPRNYIKDGRKSPKKISPRLCLPEISEEDGSVKMIIKPKTIMDDDFQE